MKREKRESRFAYPAARALCFLLSLAPLCVAGWLGRRFGDVLRVLDKKHRTRARDQAADRLGLSGRELDDFVKANFRSYGMTLAEFAHLSRMTPEAILRHVDLNGFGDRVRELRAEGRGLILITAHFGNWEWANAAFGALGYRGGSIARPLDNSRLNDYVKSVRERTGMRIFDKQGAIRKALRALRANECVGVLLDQDGGRQGLMSPFLGKPASTITIPVELAVHSGCPMILGGLRRGGGADGKRFVLVHDPETFRADPRADEKAEVRRLTDALNDGIGRMIMQAPEQWFWIHRRWKSAGKKK